MKKTRKWTVRNDFVLLSIPVCVRVRHGKSRWYGTAEVEGLPLFKTSAKTKTDLDRRLLLKIKDVLDDFLGPCQICAAQHDDHVNQAEPSAESS